MDKPDITMFFPAYNEEKNLPKIINSAEEVLKRVSNNYEILVVVYGGSTDNSIDVVRGYGGKNKHVKLIVQPIDKKGIGIAKILGFHNAKYPYIFYADSDNQFDLSEFEKFLPYIGTYDVIAGYRIKRNDPFMRIFVSRVYNLIMKFLFGTKERDLDCAFRLVSMNVIDSINLVCKTGVATTELLAKARKKGFRIKEVGVNHFPREFGEPIFEGVFMNLPKPQVVINILRDMVILHKSLRKIKK